MHRNVSSGISGNGDGHVYLVASPPQNNLGTDHTALPNSPGNFRMMHTSSRSLMERPNTTSIPDFADYRAGSEGTNKTMQYFMVGSLGVLAASGAKSTVADVLSNMAASADVLALAKIEVEMGAIPEGEHLCFRCVSESRIIRASIPQGGNGQEMDTSVLCGHLQGRYICGCQDGQLRADGIGRAPKFGLESALSMLAGNSGCGLLCDRQGHTPTLIRARVSLKPMVKDP